MLKGARKTPLSNHTLDSILGEGMIIDSRLKVSGSSLIHGIVTGDIEADLASEIVIIGVAETGSVQGNIKTHQVMVAGRVLGDVHASECIEMMATGVIEGNIEYGNLVMDEGTVIMSRMSPIKSKS